MKQLRALTALCAFLISACNLLRAEKAENMPYEGGCSVNGVKPKLNLAPPIKSRVADLAGASLPGVYLSERGVVEGSALGFKRGLFFFVKQRAPFFFSFFERFGPKFPPPPPPFLPIE